MKITNIYKKTAALFFLMAAALWPAVDAWGQVLGNKYNDDNASVTITHKAAKWFDLRSGISDAAKAMDTFDDDTKMFTLQDGTTEVQAAHTYLDTIYVHKGTSVSLEIPDKLKATNFSIKSYQRWHSFRTDGTYRTNNTGENDVWDLLTPADGISGTSYRYANGYVGYPKGANLYKVDFYVPTDDEFTKWFGAGAATTYDNKYYLVACDVSSYTDYTENFDRESSSKSSFDPKSGNPYEPTLTHRVLFYIVTVDGREQDDSPTWTNGMGRLVGKEKESYKGGPGDGKKFLEEYDISFPFTRVSNHTEELVALSKDAWSYAIPGVSKDDDNNTLNISLEDYGSGITLATKELTGMTRIIQFNYPNTNNTDKTQYVNADNSKATIYVTKTVGGVTYNIARFNLTFIRDTRLLTQTQLEQIEDGTIQNENLKYYQFRTDKYLEQNYQLLTSLNFDYDPAVADTYGSESYYPFPLAWTSNSYSFYDGANNNDFKSGNKYPEWGFYAIMNDFMEGGHWNNGTSNAYGKPLPGSNYHMYVDASDRPGVIARLPFRRKLCKGSELFVTAWVKSAGWSSSMADAGMLFSVMGVKTDRVLGTVYEPIYRHSSSQVRRTDYLSGKMPGTGSGTNEWMQMYFSFVIDADADYDSYVLQIDNNSASTDGGDMYIDDIRVYIATPSAEVKQLDATCTNERTLMSIKLDWNRLLSRLGQEEGQDKMDAIDFCFIDKAKYDDYLEENPGRFQQAIENSVVEVGDNTPGSGYNQKYNTLYFNLNFDLNATYDDKPYPRLAGQNVVDGKYCFYGTTDESGNKALAVDFYSDLTPNRTYMMLIQVNDGNGASSSDFQESINNDECGINTSFTVTAQTLLRVNGEVVDPSTDFCAGQIFNFSAQVRVPKQEADGSESYTIVDKGVYFDWFFGTEEEYMQEDPDYGVSLEQALTTFREIYPDNEDLTGVEPGQHTVAGTSESIELTENMISVIKKYLEDTGEAAGAHNRLVLHKENLDITLLNSGLKLVVQPIPMILPPDGTIDKDSWAKVCWNYVPLELNVSGDAPHLQPGFNALQYPSEEFDPSLRIGLKQIRRVSREGTTNRLTINLRKASYVSKETDHLGPLTSRLGMKYLFLIASDDPALADDLDATQGFTQYSLPVGWIDELVAHEYGEDTSYDDNMKIRFDLDGTILRDELHETNDFKFNPREGYRYTFAIPFEEKLDDNESSSNACFGQFNLTMKVVPEYLVWNDSQTKEAGETIGNWNNDENWKRIASTDINAATNNVSDYFTDGSNQTDNGFVPMRFTKVIMPENSKVELYAAGYTESGTQWDTKLPIYIAAPTENIQYDLMAYESGSPLKTERYRVSLLDEIHFEPGAEMLHAEYLLYNKAWVDYQLGKGRWYTLASPLKAVVAGDFYTDSDDGVEKQEYFTDITFTGNGLYNNDNLLNNRFNPSVYQRAWKGESTEVPLYIDATTKKNVAISGNWSALTNDVAEKYGPGTGFSLKVQDVTDNATFRLPKADTEYYYYSQNGVVGGVSSGTINRDNAYRLKSDELYERNININAQGQKKDPITISLTESATKDYYLVGNPFMAHLDMTKFFDEENGNGSVLQKKYWVVTDGNQTAAVGSGDWITLDGATPKVAPLQSFFVQKAEDVTGDITLTFTQDMQTLGGTNDGLRSANALTITATTTDGRTSRAAVVYDMAASADYEASEDAELFLDSNLGDVPMVYTVAGTMATSINRTSELYNIPLGVYGSKQEMVTLSFGGLNQFSSATLYDAQEQTETPLREGKTVSVPAGTSGRYFLRAGTPTGNEVIARNAFLVYSVGGGKVMVTSSNTPLKDIRVYTMGGAQVRSIQASGMQQEIYLNRGIYLITVSDQDGLQETKKVLVR